MRAAEVTAGILWPDRQVRPAPPAADETGRRAGGPPP